MAGSIAGFWLTGRRGCLVGVSTYSSVFGACDMAISKFTRLLNFSIMLAIGVFGDDHDVLPAIESCRHCGVVLQDGQSRWTRQGRYDNPAISCVLCVEQLAFSLAVGLGQEQELTVRFLRVPVTSDYVYLPFHEWIVVSHPFGITVTEEIANQMYREWYQTLPLPVASSADRFIDDYASQGPMNWDRNSSSSGSHHRDEEPDDF